MWGPKAGDNEMEHSEKVQRLKKMLLQVAPSGSIEAIADQPLVGRLSRAFESLEIAAEPRRNVKSGLEKIALNKIHETTPAELRALEAIVMPKYRPVVFVRGDSYDDVEDPWTALNTAATRARINPLLPLIGRIEVPNSLLLPYAGTGFVVGKNLLMTNRHVAMLFSQGLGLTIRYQAGDAAVDFKRQVDTLPDDRSAYLEVQSVEMVHPFWDMALLRVDGLPVDQALRLSVQPPEKLVGRNIIAIGYPARDVRNDLELQDQIFHKTYNLKRLQPGTVRPRAVVQSFENEVNAIVHDSSTLGGNSGSAIIDVDTGEVIALHFAGEYLKANYAVPMFELVRDSRLADKLNFQGPLPPATHEWDSAWSRTESTGAIDVPRNTPPQPPGNVHLQTPPSSLGDAHTRDLIINYSIPLRVTVSLGEITPEITMETGPKTVSEAEVEAVVVDPHYESRPGYDPDFLESVTVPLPTISKEMEADTAMVDPRFRKNKDRFELTYYHYSVYMNKRRRTAWFSAANVDGAHRPDIGKRQGDRWYSDPRIDRSEQLGQEAFEHGIDRGHLSRREDTAWGKNVADATRANNDTFHFTNCSLQASLFNRGKDRWQGLEQFLLEKHAKKDKRKMIVITGPVFAKNDPVYRNEKMNYSVRCPLQFWKVCVLIREDGSTSATAFILGQEEIADLPGFEEAFDVAATQIKIVDLEKRAHVDFGILKNHDHFAQSRVPGTLETLGGNELGRIIRTGADIVV